MNPALVLGLSEVDYHAHPALSSTGLRRLLPPSCPARFRWWADNLAPAKAEFDHGHAAHTRVLGVGDPVVVVRDAAGDPYTDWRKPAARAAADEVRAAGGVPLLAKDAARVDAIAAAVEVSACGPLLVACRDGGWVEVSAFWTDGPSGVDCRARWDGAYLTVGGRLVIVDLKTSTSAHPATFARKSVAAYGYHIQQAHYVDAAEALGHPDPLFVFCVVEKDPPYVASPIVLDPADADLGARLAARAREIYRDCEAAGVWPGYTTDLTRAAMPAWTHYDTED